MFISFIYFFFFTFFINSCVHVHLYSYLNNKYKDCNKYSVVNIKWGNILKMFEIIKLRCAWIDVYEKFKNSCKSTKYKNNIYLYNIYYKISIDTSSHTEIIYNYTYCVYLTILCLTQSTIKSYNLKMLFFNFKISWNHNYWMCDLPAITVSLYAVLYYFTVMLKMKKNLEIMKMKLMEEATFRTLLELD